MAKGLDSLTQSVPASPPSDEDISAAADLTFERLEGISKMGGLMPPKHTLILEIGREYSLPTREALNCHTMMWERYRNELQAIGYRG